LRWFNGKEFVGPFEGDIEHKKLLNDDVGPSTGCSLNVVWFYPDETSFIANKLGWDNLAEILRKHDAPPCCYDMNSVITADGDCFFLEWCARCGYDSEPAALALIGDYSSFLWNIATGQGELPYFSKSICYTTKLYVPPYPATVKDEICVGQQIFGIPSVNGVPFVGYDLQYKRGRYEVSSPLGEVGLSIATGRKMSVLNKSVVDFAKTLRPKSIGYRTDGDVIIKKDAQELMKVVPDMPKGLIE